MLVHLEEFLDSVTYGDHYRAVTHIVEQIFIDSETKAYQARADALTETDLVPLSQRNHQTENHTPHKQCGHCLYEIAEVILRQRIEQVNGRNEAESSGGADEFFVRSATEF